MVACLEKHRPFPAELGKQKYYPDGLVSAADSVEAERPRRIPLDEDKLRKAWENSQRNIKDDWAEWMRQFSVELLREARVEAVHAPLALLRERERLGFLLRKPRLLRLLLTIGLLRFERRRRGGGGSGGGCG